MSHCPRQSDSSLTPPVSLRPRRRVFNSPGDACRARSRATQDHPSPRPFTLPAFSVPGRLPVLSDPAAHGYSHPPMNERRLPDSDGIVDGLLPSTADKWLIPRHTIAGPRYLSLLIAFGPIPTARTRRLAAGGSYVYREGSAVANFERPQRHRIPPFASNHWPVMCEAPQTGLQKRAPIEGMFFCGTRPRQRFSPCAVSTFNVLSGTSFAASEIALCPYP